MITNLKSSTTYTLVQDDNEFCIYEKFGDYPIAIYDTQAEAEKALDFLTGESEVESNN
jgi:hypothetical protein